MISNITEAISGKHGFWTHWQWYRTFFQVAFIRYLALWFTLVPIFANLFKKLPPEINVNLGVTQFTLLTALPFTWELLWLSSFLFFMAFALYAWRCPRFVKNYSSYAQYKGHMHSPRWIVSESRELTKDKHELPRLIEVLVTKKYLEVIKQLPANTANEIVVGEKQTCLYIEHENMKYRLAMPLLNASQEEDRDRTDIAEREIFWEVFGRVSSSKRGTRLIIIFLLLLSLILFLIVLGQHIWATIQYFCK